MYAFITKKLNEMGSQCTKEQVLVNNQKLSICQKKIADGLVYRINYFNYIFWTYFDKKEVLEQSIYEFAVKKS